MSTPANDPTLSLIGRRLREERTRCGLALATAATELGVDRSTLSRIENGARGLDSVLLRRAAGLYEVSMEHLFEEQRPGLLIKARDLEGNELAADAMARWTHRKLDELRFVRSAIADLDG